jgi:hypothetical protein
MSTHYPQHHPLDDLFWVYDIEIHEIIHQHHPLHIDQHDIKKLRFKATHRDLNPQIPPKHNPKIPQDPNPLLGHLGIDIRSDIHPKFPQEHSKQILPNCPITHGVTMVEYPKK